MFGLTFLLAKLGLVEHGCDDSDRYAWTKKLPIFFAADPGLDRIAFTSLYLRTLRDNKQQVVLDGSAGHFMISGRNEACLSPFLKFILNVP